MGNKQINCHKKILDFMMFLMTIRHLSVEKTLEEAIEDGYFNFVSYKVCM